MRTRMLLIALFILGYSFCSAEDSNKDSRDLLEFGGKIGLNYSNVYDSQGEEFDADAKFGLAFGGFIDIPIGQYIGIQPELLFTQKGFQASGKLLGSNYKFTRTTSYIDIPIMFVFKPSKIVYLLLGPQYSYLVKQKDVFESGSSSVEQVQEFEKDNIRDNTFCIVGGADLNFNNLVFGARAGWDLFNNNGDGSSNTPRYKNVWLQATFGYKLFME